MRRRRSGFTTPTTWPVRDRPGPDGRRHEPLTESKADTKNPDRGPLLILDGEKDHTVPWAIANAAYKRQKGNPSVTEIKKMPNRGHSLTIDHGWQEVAQTALDFVEAVRPGQADPLIDCEEERSSWAVLVGMLRKAERWGR